MEVPASLLSNRLPTRAVALTVTGEGGTVRASVPGAGDLSSRRLVNDLGNKMMLQNAAFSVAFGVDGHIGDLAPSDGTSWSDPDGPEAWQGRSGVAGRVSRSG